MLRPNWQTEHFPCGFVQSIIHIGSDGEYSSGFLYVCVCHDNHPRTIIIRLHADFQFRIQPAGRRKSVEVEKLCPCMRTGSRVYCYAVAPVLTAWCVRCAEQTHAQNVVYPNPSHRAHITGEPMCSSGFSLGYFSVHM